MKNHLKFYFGLYIYRKQNRKQSKVLSSMCNKENIIGTRQVSTWLNRNTVKYYIEYCINYICTYYILVYYTYTVTIYNQFQKNVLTITAVCILSGIRLKLRGIFL